jgi:hypothetical protein
VAEHVVVDHVLGHWVAAIALVKMRDPVRDRPP